MLPLNLHHTAIAVHDLDATLRSLVELFGVEPLTREVVVEQGVEEAMVPFGGSYLQVLMPLGPDTAVGRFLDRRGEGLHHIGYRVRDCAEALASMVAAGATPIDEVPRPGSRGTTVAFVHPKGSFGTLIELVQV